jgi:CRP/FNR family transcriptional regulator
LLISKGTVIKATHSQLADELGSVREVISRILKNFEERGMLHLERGQVHILDKEALEEIAGPIR